MTDGGIEGRSHGGLVEAWRAVVPGRRAHTIMSDAVSNSLLISDGWGVAFPSLRLHKLRLSDGVETASTRTRHQSVGAMVITDESLWVATDKRLMQLHLDDLSVVAHWDRGLVAYAQQLVPFDGCFVMANWRVPTVGVFDPGTGATRRLRTGDQPIVVRHHSAVLVVAGSQGGMRRLDPHTHRLIDPHPSPAMTAAASVDGVWCVVAGAASGGHGTPPVWTKSGTALIMRVLGEPGSCQLSGRCDALFPDAPRRQLWCITGDDGSRLERVDATVGRITGTFISTHGPLRHVDPVARLAFAMNREPVEKAESVLVAYHLPTDEN